MYRRMSSSYQQQQERSAPNEQAPIRDVVLTKNEGQPFGIQLLADTQEDTAVYVAAVSEQGAAAASEDVNVGDRILAINGQSTEKTTEAKALAIIRQNPRRMELKLQSQPKRWRRASESFHRQSVTGSSRPESITEAVPAQPNVRSVSQSAPVIHHREIEVPRNDGKLQLGLVGDRTLRGQGVFISSVANERAKANGLEEGMRIMAVNGEDTSADTQVEVLNKLKVAHDPVKLKVGSDPEGYKRFIDAQERQANVHSSSASSSPARSPVHRGVGSAVSRSRMTINVPREDGRFKLGLVGNPTERGEGVYLSSVGNSVAKQAGARPGLRIVKVNGKDTRDDTQNEVLHTLASAGETVALELEDDRKGYRRFVHDNESTDEEDDVVNANEQSSTKQPSSAKRRNVTLVKKPNQPFGIQLMADTDTPGPIYVAAVTENGAAEASGRVFAGDRIMSINQKSTFSVVESEALSIIREDPHRMELVLESQDGGWDKARESFREQNAIPAAPPVAASESHVHAIPEESESTDDVFTAAPTVPALDGDTQEIVVPREDGRFKLGVVGDKEIRGHGVYIGTVNNEQARVAGLKVGHRIVKVNGQDTAEDTQVEALDKIKASGDRLRLTVKDDPQGYAPFQEVGRKLSESSLPPMQTVPEEPVAASPRRSIHRDIPVVEEVPQTAVVAAPEQAPLAQSMPFDASKVHEVNVVKGNPSESYGIQLMGDEAVPSPLFVMAVEDDSPAARAGVKQGDRVVSINGTNTAEIIETKAMSLIKAKPDQMQLGLIHVDSEYDEANDKLRRQSLSLANEPVAHPVVIDKVNGKLGFAIVGDTVDRGGVYVKTVVSENARSAGLVEHMRILKVDGHDTEFATQTEVLKRLKATKDKAILEVIKDQEGYDRVVNGVESADATRRRVARAKSAKTSGMSEDSSRLLIDLPRVNGKLGLVVVGEEQEEGHGVYVTTVNNTHASEAGLTPGMRVCKVDGRDVWNSSQKEVLTLLRNSGEVVEMEFAPSDAGYDMLVSSGQERDITLTEAGEGFGLALQSPSAESGPVFISQVKEKGAAKRNGFVREGERVIKINGRPVDKCSREELLRLLAANENIVKFTLTSDPAGYENLQRVWAANTSTIDLDDKNATAEEQIHVLDSSALGRVTRVRLRKQDGKIGCSIAGGEETPLKGTFINTVSVRQSGLVHPGDRIVAVNGINLLHAIGHGAEQAIATSGNEVEMLVARCNYTRDSTAGINNIRFDRTEAGEVQTHQLSNEDLSQLRLVFIPHGSEAEHFVELKSRGIAPGSRLLAVNDTLVNKSKLLDIVQLLEDGAAQNRIKLDVWLLPQDKLEQALFVPGSGNASSAYGNRLKSIKRPSISAAAVARTKSFSVLRNSVNQRARAPGRLSLTDEPPIATGPRTVTLERGQGGFGFTIKASSVPGPLTVGKVTAGGAADMSRLVNAGDRITSINGANTREISKGGLRFVSICSRCLRFICGCVEDAVSQIKAAGVVLHMQLE
eukprot:TRINITY_DN12231_c0_g1_i2.p1 TRINITY_DN12231_c0_g1~~TRINITY_DN12231_c0_g1_i2.p1  ORF type:complete len:1717 (+),score=466.43 TRINITY_DN12231_c0_g1_i2:664-5151(+)